MGLKNSEKIYNPEAGFSWSLNKDMNYSFAKMDVTLNSELFKRAKKYIYQTISQSRES